MSTVAIKIWVAERLWMRTERGQLWAVDVMSEKGQPLAFTWHNGEYPLRKDALCDTFEKALLSSHVASQGHPQEIHLSAALTDELHPYRHSYRLVPIGSSKSALSDAWRSRIAAALPQEDAIHWLSAQGFPPALLTRLCEQAQALVTNYSWLTLNGQEALELRASYVSHACFLRLVTRLDLDGELQVSVHFTQSRYGYSQWLKGSAAGDEIRLTCLHLEHLHPDTAKTFAPFLEASRVLPLLHWRLSPPDAAQLERLCQAIETMHLATQGGPCDLSFSSSHDSSTWLAHPPLNARLLPEELTRFRRNTGTLPAATGPNIAWALSELLKGRPPPLSEPY